MTEPQGFSRLKGLFIAGAVVVAAALAGHFDGGSYAVAAEVGTSTVEAEAAQGVKPSTVCMVNDAVMGREQIPVEFEGRTYYGCCQGCVGRLKGDRRVRYSVDPVTGSEVDKAKAFIVEGPRGEAIYFESEDTAKRYLETRMKNM